MLARALSLIPLAATAAVVVAGCRPDESPPSRAPQSAADTVAAPAAPGIVTVTAQDFAFDAPSEIPAGLTTFRLVNRGPSLHHIQLIKLEDGKTADDFFAALKGGGPFPGWASFAGGPNPPESGDTATITLAVEPGNYMMLCFIPAADGVPHVMKGMARPLTVKGPSRNATEPRADLVMKLVDYDFELSQPLTAGRHTIRVENAGTQPHEVAIVRMQPGKTPQEFAAWGMKPVGPAPGTLFGGVSGIMPGSHAFVDVDLPAGDYALLCFVPDAKDGKPHFAHGMAKRIKVG